MTAAEREWDRRDAPHVEVHAHFNIDVPIRKRGLAELARRICDVVERFLPDRDSVRRIDFDWERRAELLPEEFVSVSVIRLDSYTRSYWSGGDAAYVPKLSPELISEAVERKALARYRVEGRETWLLVVADSFRISSSFDVLPTIVDHEYRGPFDRLFLLDTLPRKVYELRIKTDVV
jgi:hypothetical protein